MPNTNTVEIRFSKGKIIKMLFYSILFLASGLWMIMYKPGPDDALYDNPVLKYGVGSFGLLMGVFCMTFFTRKFFDKKPAILIDAAGVTDNSSAISVGTIAWKDITSIGDYTVRASLFSKQKFIVLLLKNPKDYIAKQSSPLKRKTLEMNNRRSGSPITISANSLNISLTDLKALLEQKLRDFEGNKHPAHVRN